MWRYATDPLNGRMMCALGGSNATENGLDCASSVFRPSLSWTSTEGRGGAGHLRAVDRQRVSAHVPPEGPVGLAAVGRIADERGNGAGRPRGFPGPDRLRSGRAPARAGSRRDDGQPALELARRCGSRRVVAVLWRARCAARPACRAPARRTCRRGGGRGDGCPPSPVRSCARTGRCRARRSRAWSRCRCDRLRPACRGRVLESRFDSQAGYSQRRWARCGRATR